jgi:hypothetical protein
VQVVVAGGVLSLVLWFNSRTQLVHEIDRRLTTVAILRKEQIDDYLSDNIEKMELVSTRIQIVNYLANLANVSESIAQGDLESAVSAVSEFMSAAVYDRNGTLKFATDPSQYNLSLSQDAINLVRKDVHFDYPIHDPTGWKFLLSRGITLVSFLISLLGIEILGFFKLQLFSFFLLLPSKYCCGVSSAISEMCFLVSTLGDGRASM